MITTLGSGLFGLGMALIVLLPWWHKGRRGSGPGGKGAPGGAPAPSGGRNMKALGPFALAFSIGTLCTLCSGGLFGSFAAKLSSGAGAVGGQALKILTGAAAPALARHAQAKLSPEGSAILVLLVVGVIVLWKQSGRTDHKDTICGLLSGITLGPTAGIGALAATILAPLVNQVGGWAFGWL